MENKRKLFGSFIGIIIFIICITSLTYAYYSWKSTNTNINVGIHDGGIKYIYSHNNILTSNTLSPVLDYQSNDYYQNNNGSLLYSDYTATNTKDDTHKMILRLNITEISDSLKDPSFKWVLLEKSSTAYSKVVIEGDFSKLNKGPNDLNKGIPILPGESHEYRFIIYIDGNMPNNSSMMNSQITSDLELCDEKMSLININLNNKGATPGKEGTSKIYEKFGIGIYKDSTANTTLMTTTSNNITIPIKTGYTFQGYYNKENGEGEQLINKDGYLTDKFTKTKFDKDTTLYANWTANSYKITYDNNFYPNNLYLWTDTINLNNYRPLFVENSKELVPDSNVLGGNYIKLTINSNKTSSSLWRGIYFSDRDYLKSGQKYTWSVYVKTSSPKKMQIGHEQGGYKEFQVTQEWQKLTMTFIATETSNRAFVFYIFSNDDYWTAGDILYIHSLEIMEGEPIHTSATKTYDNPIGSFPPNPTRTGYNFLGWYDSPTGGNKIETTTKVPAQDITYYAHWQII